MDWTAMVVSVTFFVVLMIVLGYFAQKTSGAAWLGGPALVACGCVVAGHALWGLPGLIMGVFIGGMIGVELFVWQVQGNSRQISYWVWSSYWILVGSGYYLSSLAGIFTLAIAPSVLALAALYAVSAYILPISGPNQRGTAFKSLSTYLLGTNYPYYVIGGNSQTEMRLGGNPFGQFFAGPGIVMSPPDHAVYVGDEVMGRRIEPPGLVFTNIFEKNIQPIDLRPQLRAFHLKATTKDGIPIKVLTFVPYRIDNNGQDVGLGEHYPFNPDAAWKAVTHKLADRDKLPDDTNTEHRWDSTLVEVVTTRVMQDIISHYTVDELCEPDRDELDPRVTIAKEMRTRVGELLKPHGLVVIGGGISNLIPPGKVIDQRIETWFSEMERKWHYSQHHTDTERELLLSEAYAELEQLSVETFQKIKAEKGGPKQAHQAWLRLMMVDVFRKFLAPSHNGASETAHNEKVH